MTQSNLPALIDKMEPEFSKALAGAIPSARFTRIARTAVMSSPDIMAADRASLFGAITKAAQDQLVLDGREAAIVMYKDKAQYMPMVAGLVKKMRQHPEFDGLSTGIIYDNEFKSGAFKYIKGDHEELHHEPIIFGDRGEKIGAYAVLTTKSGQKFRAVMSKEEILKRKASSRGASSPHGPWVKWEDEMWIKTVLKRLYAIAPNSGDVMGVLDGVFDDDLHQDVVESAPSVPQEPEKKQTRAAAAVKAQSSQQEPEYDDIPDAEIVPDEHYEPPM